MPAGADVRQRLRGGYDLRSDCEFARAAYGPWGMPALRMGDTQAVFQEPAIMPPAVATNRRSATARMDASAIGESNVERSGRRNLVSGARS